jgi:predicted RNA-binding protein associated with RNAse of E/G family
MTQAGDPVEIHYLRLPSRRTVFRQRLIHHDPSYVVTLMERTPLDAPVRAGGAVILEPDAAAVWFTFRGRPYDVGRFHTAAGDFTGYYTNLLTPVTFRSPVVWETTDLFLDVWQPAGTITEPHLLDVDELQEALGRGWLDATVAQAARVEAARIVAAARVGSWPPAIVLEWNLARTRAAAALAGGTREAGPV